METQTNPDQKPTARPRPYDDAALRVGDPAHPFGAPENAELMTPDVFPFGEGKHAAYVKEVSSFDAFDGVPDELKTPMRAAMICGVRMVRWFENAVADAGLDAPTPRLIADNLNDFFRAVQKADDAIRFPGNMQPGVAAMLDKYWRHAAVFAEGVALMESERDEDVDPAQAMLRKLREMMGGVAARSCTNPACLEHHPETAFKMLHDEEPEPLADAPYSKANLEVGDPTKPLSDPANAEILSAAAFPLAEDAVEDYLSDLRAAEDTAGSDEARVHLRTVFILLARHIRRCENAIAAIEAEGGSVNAEQMANLMNAAFKYAMASVGVRPKPAVGPVIKRWLTSYWRRGPLASEGLTAADAMAKQEFEDQQAAAKEALADVVIKMGRDAPLPDGDDYPDHPDADEN